MKVELTITALAAQLGVSERTALRRISDGKLTAKKLGPNRYLVKSEDIEDLSPRAKLADLDKQVKALMTGHIDTVSSPEGKEQITALAAELSAQSAIIDALRQEVEDLRTRVMTLEQADGSRSKRPARRVVADVNYGVKSQAVTPDTAKADKPVSKHVQATTSTRPDLPNDWCGWTPFIERHNVSAERRSIMRLNKPDYCQSGEYMLNTGKGKTLVKCALGPDGQERLLTQLWGMEFQTELRQCDVEACPCHQVFPQTLWK
jgi:excisionase family DNA binding protein